MWKKSNSNSIKKEVLFNLFFIYAFIIVGIFAYFYFSELVTKKDAAQSRRINVSNIISTNRIDLVSEIYLKQAMAIGKHLDMIKAEGSLDEILLITSGGKYGDVQMDITRSHEENRIFLTEDLVYNNEKLGELIISADIIGSTNNLLIHKYGMQLIVFACSIILISLFSIVVLLRKKIIDPIRMLSKQIENTNGVDEPSYIKSTSIRELDVIVCEINAMRRRIICHVNEHNQIQKNLMVSRVATQVAHDIRSPLTALDVAVSSINEVPEESRILIRNAVSRIRDIANNLICKSREVDVKAERVGAVEKMTDVRSVCLLPSLLDELVSEKRLYYRAKIGVAIEIKLGIESYGLFANIQPTEFKRILSNLINNAVEALSDGGRVIIYLGADKGNIIVRVEDTGKGIPPSILSKLMERGVTFGKDGGLGLGLYHAKSVVESWDGTIMIESEVGKGTVVTLELNREKSPDWFVPKLDIASGTTVIILDDDISIHQIWQRRFNILDPQKCRLNVLHFSEHQEMKTWYMKNKDDVINTIFLFDYEIIGQMMNGLDLIRELGIQEKSILVTSHYEEPGVLNECSKLGVKLIPKPMAGIVPVKIEEDVIKGDQEKISAHTKPDCILIDDDKMIHISWKMSAKKNNKNIKMYSTYEDFLNEIDQIGKETSIYIDSNLGNDIRGEDVSKEIYNAGFKNIYLATGYSKSDFGDLPWIKEIVGKNPPWVTSEERV